jgi:hypothetical protein
MSKLSKTIFAKTFTNYHFVNLGLLKQLFCSDFTYSFDNVKMDMVNYYLSQKLKLIGKK